MISLYIIFLRRLDSYALTASSVRDSILPLSVWGPLHDFMRLRAWIASSMYDELR